MAETSKTCLAHWTPGRAGVSGQGWQTWSTAVSRVWREAELRMIVRFSLKELGGCEVTAEGRTGRGMEAGAPLRKCLGDSTAETWNDPFSS